MYLEFPSTQHVSCVQNKHVTQDSTKHKLQHCHVLSCPTASNNALQQFPSVQCPQRFTTSHSVLQGKPVCIAFSQQAGQEPFISPGIMDHIIGIDSLHNVPHGLLTVLQVSLKDSGGLYDLLQWVKTSTHSQ